jgi:predicted transcriptional regulator
MDGGRILRAGLAWKIGRLKATKIATIVGRVIAAIFVLFGIYYQDYIFAMLGLFVFFTAGAESNEIEKSEKLASILVKDFTNRNFTKIHLGDNMGKLFELIKTTGESNFLVYDSLGYVIGTIPSYFVTEAMKKNTVADSVNNWLSDRIFSIQENQTLKDAFEILNKEGAGILIVKNENSEVIGAIDREAITRALSL